MSSKRSTSTPSSAATTIVVGNDDLLIEILLFLPAKSLVRFKLVSKQWRSLISAPSFCRRHTLHHSRRHPETQPSFFLGTGYDSQCLVYNPLVPRFFTFLFPFGISRVQILQSSNGLLLLLCETAKGGYSYYVFNPTTMQQRELSTLPTRSCSIGAIYLLFDPSLSPHYKVVCFAYAKKCTCIYVYDSETHTWKLGGECNKRASSFRKGIYFNGGIYLVRVGGSSRFDPENNVSEIPNPPRHHPLGRYRNYRNYVMESNGILLCLTLYWKQDSNLLIVSEMKKNENRWTKKYEADMNPILDTCARGLGYYLMDLLGIIKGQKEQDSLLLLKFNRKMMIYRFYDNGFEVVLDFEQYFQENGPSRVWEFKQYHLVTQSLAPV